MFGPILRGKMVTLRPPTETDLPNFVRWFADREVTRYFTNVVVYSIQQEEDWFKRVAEDRSTVVWSLEVEGKHVGSIGIRDVDWVHAHGTTGILIGDKEHWGKGVATEAMALRTRYAFRELNLHKLKTYVLMENEASKRALVRSGYRQIGILREEIWRDGRWQDMWIAEVLREDWERDERPGEGLRQAAPLPSDASSRQTRLRHR